MKLVWKKRRNGSELENDVQLHTTSKCGINTMKNCKKKKLRKNAF